MSAGMTRLIDTYGHKPACNDAGNPPGCTCEEEAQAHLKTCVDALAERIDRAGVEKFATLISTDGLKAFEVEQRRPAGRRPDYIID